MFKEFKDKFWSLDEKNRAIIIIQFHYDMSRKIIAWAKERPELYYVFNSGVIRYKNDAGKDWFLLKWT
jgi:hypothetical protein